MPGVVTERAGPSVEQSRTKRGPGRAFRSPIRARSFFHTCMVPDGTGRSRVELGQGPSCRSCCSRAGGAFSAPPAYDLDRNASGDGSASFLSVVMLGTTCGPRNVPTSQGVFVSRAEGRRTQSWRCGPAAAELREVGPFAPARKECASRVPGRPEPDTGRRALPAARGCGPFPVVPAFRARPLRADGVGPPPHPRRHRGRRDPRHHAGRRSEAGLTGSAGNI